MKKVIIYIIITFSLLTISCPTIVAGVHANFYWLPTNPKIGEVVKFYDASTFTDGEEYERGSFDFNGDGIYEKNGPQTTHIFFSKGSYSINYFVKGTYGNTDTINKNLPAPDSKVKINDLMFFRLVERYPKLVPILQFLIKI